MDHVFCSSNRNRLAGCGLRCVFGRLLLFGTPPHPHARIPRGTFPSSYATRLHGKRKHHGVFLFQILPGEADARHSMCRNVEIFTIPPKETGRQSALTPSLSQNLCVLKRDGVGRPKLATARGKYPHLKLTRTDEFPLQ